MYTLEIRFAHNNELAESHCFQDIDIFYQGFGYSIIKDFGFQMFWDNYLEPCYKMVRKMVTNRWMRSEDKPYCQVAFFCDGITYIMKLEYIGNEIPICN